MWYKRSDVMIKIQALYGLRSSRAAWHAYFSDFNEQTLGFKSTCIVPDIYRRQAK